MHSIRLKITAILVAAVLVAGLSVFLVGSFTIQAETDRESVKTMNLVAHDTQLSLEAYTGSIEQSVELIGNLAGDTLDSVELVRGGVVGPAAVSGQRTPEQAERLDAYLSQYCERILEVASVVASHTPGIVTYFYCINPDISDTQHGFFYSRAGKPVSPRGSRSTSGSSTRTTRSTPLGTTRRSRAGAPRGLGPIGRGSRTIC